MNRRAAHGIMVALLLLFGMGAARPALADYTVIGKFLYEDREFDLQGFTGINPHKPIRFADVRIMANGGELARGATAEDGSFSIVVPGAIAQSIHAICIASSGSTPDLMLEVRVATDNKTPGDYYSVSSSAKASPGSGIVDLGATLATADSDVGKAFNIWDVVNDGFDMVASPSAAGNRPAEMLRVLWRADHHDSGSSYSPSRRRIYMGSTAGYDDSVVGHELGHFLTHVFSKSDSPGGTHYLGDGKQDIRLAWSEGLATFLNCSIRKFKGYNSPEIYVRTDGVSLSYSYEVESMTGHFNAMPGSIQGSTNELAVTAALWDITDGLETMDASPGVDDDQLGLPFFVVWKTLAQYMPGLLAPGISAEDFWDGWFSPLVDNGHLWEMEQIFSDLNGIEFVPDTMEGDNSPAEAPLVAVGRIPKTADGPKVLISEIDPGRTDSIELYNAGNRQADITGWRVTATAPGHTTRTFILPSFRLAPGAHVVLSEASGSNTDQRLYFNRNISWAHGEGGACALQDGLWQGRDFVRWGYSAEIPVQGTSFDGMNPAAVGSGKNLSRNFAADDADSASDWMEQNPSLGTHNFGGREIHHTFYPSEDTDLTVFNALEGTRYRIETFNVHNGGHAIFELLASDGETVLDSSLNPGTFKSASLRWTAPATARYYVRSRRYGGYSNYAEYGSYELRITAEAALTVSKSGPPGRFKTISEAVEAASGGDTIEILDSSVYSENIRIFDKDLIIRALAGNSPVLSGADGLELPALEIDDSIVKIEGLVIRGGSPGILISSGSATITNTVVYRAGGIQVRGPSSRAGIIHSTISENVRGILVQESGSARIINSIVTNNTLADVTDDGSASLEVSGSIVGSGSLDQNTGEPNFRDPINGDFRLLASSPAIDQGNLDDPELPPFDADGITRSTDGNGDGTPAPDIGAYEFLPREILPRASFFPQLAIGDPYETSIIVLNTGTEAKSVQLALYDSGGEPLPAMIRNRRSDRINMELNPFGLARLNARSDGATTAGYAGLFSSSPTEGSALFRTIARGDVISQAGVGIAKPNTNFFVYIDNKLNALSGYALANPGDRPASINLVLRSAEGITLDRTAAFLEAGQHIAEFGFQRFPDAATAGFEGSIEFESDLDLYAVALRFDNEAQDVFSTIPVSAGDPSRDLYFPQVADGQGYRTNFILVNPSDSDAVALLEFFSDDGSPLELPIEGEAKTSHQVLLHSNGVGSFSTDGNATVLKTGWVRVTCPAAISGSAVFQTIRIGRIQSEAGVASSPLSRRFVSYVESLGYAESGLALCNPSSEPATISLKLRNPSGEIVASKRLALTGMGHTAKFFSSWFPHGFEDFQGTLEVTADHQLSGVALRYDNLPADVFATLPLIPLN